MSAPKCLDCGGEMQLVTLYYPDSSVKSVLRCPWVTREAESDGVAKGVVVMFCRRPFVRGSSGEIPYEGPR